MLDITIVLTWGFRRFDSWCFRLRWHLYKYKSFFRRFTKVMWSYRGFVDPVNLIFFSGPVNSLIRRFRVYWNERARLWRVRRAEGDAFAGSVNLAEVYGFGGIERGGFRGMVYFWMKDEEESEEREMVVEDWQVDGLRSGWWICWWLITGYCSWGTMWREAEATAR